MTSRMHHLEIPYETVRRWVLKFGSAVAVTCAVCGLDPKTPGTWMRW